MLARPLLEGQSPYLEPREEQSANAAVSSENARQGGCENLAIDDLIQEMVRDCDVCCRDCHQRHTRLAYLEGLGDPKDQHIIVGQPSMYVVVYPDKEGRCGAHSRIRSHRRLTDADIEPGRHFDAGNLIF